MSSLQNDVMSITNLLTDDHSVDLEYASRDLATLLPMPFQGSSVSFDFQSIDRQWTEWNNSWLALPITVTPQAADFSPSPVLAFKGSIISMIRGIEVKTSSGQTLVSETNGSTPFAAHLRMMLQNNNDWSLGTAPALMFSKDRAPSGVPSGLFTKASIQNPKTAKYTDAVSATANSDNPVCNVGFLERNAALLDSTFGLDGSYVADKKAGFSTTLNIPLRYLSDFFSALDFPIVNTRLVITFHLNTSASASSYAPICLGTTLAGTKETGTAPVVAVTAGAQPLLYYYRVTFPTLQAEMVAKKSLTGFKKTIVFTQTDIDYTQTGVASTSNFQRQVATAVNAPKRVWVLSFPAGVVNGINWPSPLVTGADTGLNNVNIQINGIRYLSNSLSSLSEQYAALSSAMAPSGMNGEANKMISYAEFCKTYRLICLDISRSGNRQMDPNAPVNLLIEAAPSTATAADIIYLVEKEIRINLTFGASPIVVEVGPNAV